MRPSYGVFAIVIALLAGCSSMSSLPSLPDSLGESGLLVARVYIPGPGNQRWENSEVTIDNRVYNSSFRDGYLAIALPSGEHTLKNLRLVGTLGLSRSDESSYRKVRGGGGGGYRAPTYTYTPGSSFTIHYTTLPLDRTFKIESGKVVNLGLITVIRDLSETKKFRTFTFNNSAEMRYYLEANYPKLTAGLKDTDYSVAPGTLADDKGIALVRQLIAYQEMRGGRWLPDANVIYGDAGTIVRIKKGADGKPNLEVVATSTLADIVDVQRDGKALLFLTANARLLRLDDNRLETQVLPVRMHPARFLVFDNGLTAIVDNHFRVTLSMDRGQRWFTYTEASNEEGSIHIGMARGTHGFYVYRHTVGVPSVILYRDNRKEAFSRIEAPSGGAVSQVADNALVENERGLFVFYGASKDFHFRPLGSEKWEVRTKPAPSCGAVRFSESGNLLQTKCSDGEYGSRDAGATWTKTVV